MHFYQLIRLTLDRPSQLDHVRKTPTQFNFKLEWDKESNQEVSRLTCWAEFNNNAK
jgi:hypothetical protein